MRVAIVAPSFFGYEKAIARAVVEDGHSVVTFDDRPSNSNITKVLIRFGFTQVLQKRIQLHKKDIVRGIVENKIQTVLVISPEVFDRETVFELREKIPGIRIVLYLWDSIRNKGNSKSFLEVVDIAYSFDRIDTENYPNLIFHPLFFEQVFEQKSINSKRIYDCAFIGTFHSNRSNLLYLFKEKNLNIFFHLYVQGPIVKLVRSFKFLDKPTLLCTYVKKVTTKALSKENVAEILHISKAIIDFQHPLQSGLTCRTFEALASGCRLVTTNQDITNYSFYDPKMIHIMKNENDFPIDYLRSEIDVDAQERMAVAIAKYSLKKWIAVILS